LKELTKRLVERALEGEMTHHLGYPPEIRKVICTTNAIESMQASLRKMTRQWGTFPNAEGVRKVMYLALQRFSKNWQRPVLDWVAALNHFTMVFEGRIPE
jgi:putative transposase